MNNCLKYNLAKRTAPIKSRLENLRTENKYGFYYQRIDIDEMIETDDMAEAAHLREKTENLITPKFVEKNPLHLLGEVPTHPVGEVAHRAHQGHRGEKFNFMGILPSI